MGFFLGGVYLDLCLRELLLQLEILQFNRLILAIRLSFLQFDLIHQVLFLDQLLLSFVDFIGQKFDLLAHGMV